MAGSLQHGLTWTLALKTLCEFEGSHQERERRAIKQSISLLITIRPTS